MVNRLRIAILAILIPLALLFSHLHAGAAARFRNLQARTAILAEVDTGKVLFERNMNMRHPADSLAKVMTMLLAISAIEDGLTSAGELIEMTETALFDITSRSSTQGIAPGEEMTLLDLMYSAFVGGANEACNLIAEHIAGSVEEFVVMMNELAKELGCENTNFTNPHGQFHENQYTTAFDQFLIYREAISHQLFLDVSGTFRHTIGATNRSDQRRFTGTNSLLNSGGRYYFRPCTSGLASATFEGGYSFVALAEMEGMSLIAVVLGSDVIMFEDESAEMRNLTEARRLFEWGFEHFGWRTILSPIIPVARAPIMHGAGADYINLVPETEIRELLDNEVELDEFIRDIIIYSEEDGETLYAPISAGEILGEITLTRGGVVYGPVLLLASTSIDLHSLESVRMQVMELISSETARTVIWILVTLVAGYIALVIRYNVIRIRRMRRIKAAKKKLTEEQPPPQKIDVDNPPPRRKGV
jgi:D-alanyl-D-alanine carboxypeptidase (penicillin-binding protein 5/6)